MATFARMQLAVEMWPSSMSATGRLRFSMAARKSSMCRRVAGAAFSSMPFSVTSSGYCSCSYTHSLWIASPLPCGMKS